MTAATTERPATENTTGSSPGIVGPESRAERRAAVKAAQRTGRMAAKTPGRDVVVEFSSGIDFRLDHRDPGRQKVRPL